MADGLALKTVGLVKHFGRVRAVDGIALEVPTGSVFGLIGPNGAGKTTTFSLICGWIRPGGGSLEVLGESPSRVARLKGRLAALPQDAALPPNIGLFRSLVFYGRLQGLGRAEARDAADRALDLVGLKEWKRVRALTLSHGMAKRVGLAQAFIGDPELVLLDEPTAGLDPKSAHHIRDLVRQLKGKATVIVSSHNLYELEELCDHAAIMDRGRIVAQGSIAELTEADTEVVIELADPPERFPDLVRAVEALSEVATASVDERRAQMVVRFSTSDAQPADVITRALEVLIREGAHIGGVHRGKGLERKVLEIT